MARVLITGATGFIGQCLLERLVARGDEVTCFARSSPRAERLASAPVRVVLGEFSDRESLAQAVRGSEIVYHLAGATVGRSRDDYFRVNQRYVADLADACAAEESPPLLVHVSSLAAAGPTKFRHPHVETDPPKPVSIYGQSKWGGERGLFERAHRLPISIARPPIVFGPRDQSMLNLFRTVRTGLMIIPSWRRQDCSLIYVDDLVDGLIRIAERGQRLVGPDDPQFQGVYYLSLLERPTYGELGLMIGQAMGNENGLWKLPLPNPLVYAVGSVSEMLSWFQSQPSIINLDKVREATAGSWTCLPERANRELEFCPSLPLSERLRQTADWYFSENWLKRA